MSRVAKNPINVPDNVELNIVDNIVKVKGSKGELEFNLPSSVSIENTENVLTVKYNEDDQQSVALAGTTRSIVNNMIMGVSEGFEKMPNVEQGTVNRLGEMAEKSKATVTIISTDSEEGISLQKAFGGLAAMLRYPIS